MVKEINKILTFLGQKNLNKMRLILSQQPAPLFLRSIFPTLGKYQALLGFFKNLVLALLRRG